MKANLKVLLGWVGKHILMIISYLVWIRISSHIKKMSRWMFALHTMGILEVGANISKHQSGTYLVCKAWPPGLGMFLLWGGKWFIGCCWLEFVRGSEKLGGPTTTWCWSIEAETCVMQPDIWGALGEPGRTGDDLSWLGPVERIFPARFPADV